MIVFPDSSVETEYTDPNGAVWKFNGTGWVRQPASSGGGGGSGSGQGGGTGITHYLPDTSLWSDVVFVKDFSSSTTSTMGQQGLKIDDNNTLVTNCVEGVGQGFFWIKNDGRKITDAIELLAPIEGTSDGQMGDFGESDLRDFINYCSVVIEGKAYIVSGSSRTNLQLFEVSESGVRNIKYTPEANSDTSTFKLTSSRARLCGWGTIHPQYYIPYVFRSGDDEITTIAQGYALSDKNPAAKFCRYGLDGTFRGEYQSAIPTPSYSGFAGEAFPFGGWKQDPANDRAAVGVFWYRERSGAAQPQILFVYYADLEAGTVTCVNLGENQNLLPQLNQLPLMNFYPIDENNWYIELDQANTSAQLRQYAWVLGLPADRQGLDTNVKISFINSQRIDCTTLAPSKNMASDQKYWPDRSNPYITYCTKDLDDSRRLTPGFGSYSGDIYSLDSWGAGSVLGKRGERAFGGLLPGAGMNGYKELSQAKAFASGSKSYAVALPQTAYFVDQRGLTVNSPHILSSRSDNGAALFGGLHYDTAAKQNFPAFFMREPGEVSDLRLKIKVVDGKVVGEPTVPRLEDTSGPEWVEVVTVADDIGEFQKLGDITYEYDDKTNTAILRREAVEMTEAEILEAKALKELNEAQSDA